MVRRDTGKKEFVKESKLAERAKQVIEEMHKDMFKKAEKFLKENSVEAKTWPDFKKVLAEKKLILAPFCNTTECEEKIKKETTATSRCIPFDQKNQKLKCIKCGKETSIKAWFGKSY